MAIDQNKNGTPPSRAAGSPPSRAAGSPPSRAAGSPPSRAAGSPPSRAVGSPSSPPSRAAASPSSRGVSSPNSPSNRGFGQASSGGKMPQRAVGPSNRNIGGVTPPKSMGGRPVQNQGVYIETDVGEDEVTVGGVVASVGTSIGYALLYVIMVIGISVVLACVGWIVANDVLALNKIPHEVVIDVTEYDDFDSVAEQLKDEGIIDYKFVFDLFATFTNKKESISPGTYTVDTDMDYNALIRNLGASSDTKAQVKVTIPEGYTVDQIFQVLAENNVASVEDLQETAANYDYKFDFLRDEVPLGDYHRLEGYLYPDTYEFYVYHNPIYVLNTMLCNFYYRVIENDEISAYVESSGYSLNEVLNIAAMIERETDSTDRNNISSVIYNRLKNPSYETNGCLQIDATIYYLTGRDVTQNDRETLMNPYNTHINAGLPPGPICNPGIESILAAVSPSNTNYYYYALGDDGLHHFYQSYSSLSSFIASQSRYN